MAMLNNQMVITLAFHGILVLLTCAFYGSGIFGNDPLANYQFHHPSNPIPNPSIPYVKRTSKMITNG